MPSSIAFSTTRGSIQAFGLTESSASLAASKTPGRVTSTLNGPFSTLVVAGDAGADGGCSASSSRPACPGASPATRGSPPTARAVDVTSQDTIKTVSPIFRKLIGLSSRARETTVFADPHPAKRTPGLVGRLVRTVLILPAGSRGVLVCTSRPRDASKPRPGHPCLSCGCRKAASGAPHNRPASMSNDRPSCLRVRRVRCVLWRLPDLRLHQRRRAGTPDRQRGSESWPPGSRRPVGLSPPSPALPRVVLFPRSRPRCTIYETRPEVCREFAAGDQPCQQARAMRDLPPLSPIDRRERPAQWPGGGGRPASGSGRQGVPRRS